MKITQLQVHILRAPDTGRPHWVSHFIVPKANEILVRIQTDEGIEGIGLATSYTPIEAAIDAVKTGIADLIVGADALAPEALYQKLFALTWQCLSHEKKWTREAIVRISAAVDIALWDIVGKKAGLPLYRLFGGYRNVVPCYVTCAYYRDGKTLSELKDEMQMLKGQGHTGFKAKAGGLPLAQDMQRLELVREVDDRRELKLLAQKTRIPLSAGESELTSYGCRALLEEGAIQILQFDCTMMGGFTEGRKLSALCEFNHVQVAPHHDCFIHAHIVAASPAGVIVESFTDPERDPLQAELFEDPPKIAKGMLTLKEQPGLGLTLSERALKKFGERIL